jgi:hypothetical protein
MTPPCGSLITDVSEELSASFIRVTRIGELGTILALTSKSHTARAIPTSIPVKRIGRRLEGNMGKYGLVGGVADLVLRWEGWA